MPDWKALGDEAVEITRQYLRINTTNPPGNETPAAEFLAGILQEAGFETTIGLIANGVRCLLQHPDELARLRRDPSLIETAVDECLRFDGPIILTVRILHDDAEFGGRTLTTASLVSKTAVTFGGICKSTRWIASWIASALTSTSMYCGMSLGRHSTWMSRKIGCRMPPSATPTGLPMKCSGTVTCRRCVRSTS